MRRFRQLARRLSQRFYRGPVELGIELPRRRGYQSPTLTALLWGYAFFCRHFTYPGILLFFCLGFILPLGMLSLLMPVHLLAFGVMALFGANAAIGFLVRPRLDVSRQVPTRVRAGERFQVRYQVRNLAARPVFDLRLDSLPWPNSLVRVQPNPPLLRDLAPGATASGASVHRAGRRGVFRAPAMRADSAFPFHLWCWGRTSTAGPAPVIVHPRFTRLQRLGLPSQYSSLPGESGWAAALGASHEFTGCREFRAGDSPRHVHWRSWARTGYPVIKEFQDYYQFQALVAVDTWRAGGFWRRLPGHVDPICEAAISLGAAVCEFLTTRRAGVHLLVGSPASGGAGHPGVTALDLLLDRLAALKPQRRDGFERIAVDLRNLPVEPACAYLICLEWNALRRALVDQLRQRDVPVQVFLVQSPGGAATAPLPAGVTALAVADIVAGRCLDLAGGRA